MLQILYKNEPLDISQDDNAELQQTSPLFGIEQSFGEYSTPITIQYSDRNNRLLRFYFLELTSKEKITLPVTVMENGTNMGIATLVIESSALDRDYVSETALTGYLLLNVSDFFQSIKDKKLTQLKLGGPRTFEFTTLDPTDGSGGYWQHFFDTFGFAYDYVFPMINTDSGYLNVYRNGVIVSANKTFMYPFIKLKYILESIFLEAGWTVDFTGLNDTDWQKLVVFPSAGIKVGDLGWAHADTEWLPTYYPVATLTYNLASLLDPNYTCSTFILQVCYRYGWAPITDVNAKVCRFAALKENANFSKKDWTKYAQTSATEAFLNDPIIYSYKNNFTGSDDYTTDVSITGFTIGTPVATKYDLPDPVSSLDNTLIFCEVDNKYYQVVFDGDLRLWQPYRDNIYDYIVENSTVDIQSDVTTLPLLWALYDTNREDPFYALTPFTQQKLPASAGLRFLFYWGQATETREDGTEGDFNYPFTSPVNFKPYNDSPVGDWANVFLYSNDVEYGIVKYWFEKWTTVSWRGNEVTRNFNLPLHELLNFKWDEKILVNNIEYLVKQLNRPIPYSGYVQCVLRRMQTNIANAGAAATVYLRIETEEIATDVDGITIGSGDAIDSFDNCTQGYAWVRAYSDEAGTIPVQTTLLVKYRRTRLYEGDEVDYFDYSANITGDIEKVLNDADRYYLLSFDYSANYDSSMPEGHWEYAFELLEGNYVIII